MTQHKKTTTTTTAEGLGDIEGMAAKIPLSWLRPNQFQPRSKPISSASIDDLADSIRENMDHGGVLEPIIVRYTATENVYEIVAGERRWRASKIAGLEKIPAIIRHYSDEQAARFALIENIQRENLNAAEEAKAIKNYIDTFGLTHQQAAERLGKSRSTISHAVRMCELLDPLVFHMLYDDHLTAGHARAIMMLPKEQHLSMAKHVERTKCSVHDLEKMCSRLANKGKEEDVPIKKPKEPNIFHIENRLSELLGTSVKFIHDPIKGSGEIRIQYYNLEICDGILEKIKGFSE